MGKFIDLKGQKFAHLTVLERVENNKHNQVQYKCLCDCGRECVVIGMNIKNNKAQSCGCRTFHKTNLQDITGQKFGSLTVLGRADNQGTRTMWNVRCDCGNELVVLGANLKRGNTTSCGCKKEPNLTGKVFGRLTVLERVENRIAKSGKTDRQFLCRCQCGKEIIVPAFRLLNGSTRSCGCLAAEQSVIRNTTHGESDSRLYHIWTGMKQRCHNPKSPSYKNYGARGIIVCDEWFDDFQAFYDWAMSNGYDNTLSIDRINSNDIYKPSNCRWATMEVQQNNKRNNHLLTYNGETLTVNQMARKYGLNIGVFKCNISKGMDVATAIKTTSKAKKAM